MFYKPIYCLILYASALVGAQQCPIPNGNTVTFPDVSDSVQPMTSKLKTSYDAQGLQSFFDLANSFMNTVQSDPIDSFSKEDFEKLSDQAAKDKLIKYETPIAVAVGFGLLFAFVMPVVGLCFCCCRCCGNCGGEMVQKEDDAGNHTKCCICSFILLVLVIFFLCGVLFMFVCNGRLKTAVNDVGPQYIQSIDEGIGYANTTINELEFLANDQLNCAINIVLNDISDEGIKTHLGGPIRDALTPRIGIALDAVIQATTSVSTMSNKLKIIQNSTRDLRTAAGSLSTSLEDIRVKLTDLKNNCSSLPTASSKCNAIDPDALQQNANFSNLPNVDNELSSLQTILQNNFSGAALEGKRVFDNIPTTVSDKSISVRADIRIMIGDGQQKLKDTVLNLTRDIDNELVKKRQDFVKYRKDYIDDVEKYDKYRDYGFLGMSCVAALILLCLGLGLVCGVCGYNRQTEPSNRSTLSNCGGNCLMAGVGFMFIFSFFLMLFTVISFAVGIHLHIVCDGIKDARAIDKFVDGSLKFDDKVIKVGDILRSCRDNEPIYGAINGKRFLDVDDKINITKLVGNVDEEINKLNVSLSDQSILNNKTRTALTDLSTSNVDNINFDSFFNELRKNILQVDLASLIANLTDIETELRQAALLAPASSAEALANDTKEIIVDLEAVRTTSLPDIRTRTNQLAGEVSQLSVLASGLRNVSLDILQKLEDAESFLRTSAGTDVISSVLVFSRRVLGWLDQFAQHVKSQITTKVARCKPIANLYDSIVSATVCGGLVGNFNGFWLALGWCLFFFIPLIIFAVKLAKYYRRMKCIDGFGTHDFNTYPSYDRNHDKIPLQQMDRPPPYNHEYQNNGYKGH